MTNNIKLTREKTIWPIRIVDWLYTFVWQYRDRVVQKDLTGGCTVRELVSHMQEVDTEICELFFINEKGQRINVEVWLTVNKENKK